MNRIEWKKDKNPYANGENGRAGKVKIVLFHIYRNSAVTVIDGVKANWIMTTIVPGYTKSSWTNNTKDELKDSAEVILDTFLKNFD